VTQGVHGESTSSNYSPTPEIPDSDQEVKKRQLYHIITATDFDPTGEHDPTTTHTVPITKESPPAIDKQLTTTTVPSSELSPRTLRICHRVMASLIEDFTPTLFTVGTAQHMACTDVLAERWMDDVIAPALADGGVGRPMETLARIQTLAAGSWRERGVCESCVVRLHDEWENERKAIWEWMGRWIKEAENAEI